MANTITRESAVKRRARDIYNLFVSCSLYLNLNVVLMLVISGLVLDTNPAHVVDGMVAGVALMTAVYIFDRTDITEEDTINNPKRTALIERYRPVLKRIAIGSLGLYEVMLMTTVVTLDLAGVVALLLGHLSIFITYTYDSIKTASIPLDSTVVALCWSYMVLYIYTFMTPAQPAVTESAALFGGWFLIVFAGLEARNIKDIEGDRKTGKVTCAVILGKRLTRYAELLLKSVGSAVLVAVSGSILVVGLIVVHLFSLWAYGHLEASFRRHRDADVAT